MVSPPMVASDPMRLALEQARAAGARGEVPVGAVIVGEDGTVLAADGNRMEEMRDATAHAEMLAIREACRRVGAGRLVGCDMHVTLEPCAMCAAAISFARIRRLYFGAEDAKSGGAEFFSQAACHHAPEVYGGIGERESAALLREFFRAKRAAV